jgi:hypothetical protein
VTFTPTAAGGTVGSLDLTTLQARFPIIGVSLSGAGTRPGLFATTSSDQFLHTFIGVPGEDTVAVTNGGTKNVTVTSVRPPKAPFSVSGLPEPGTVLRPGETAEVQVHYAPARPGQGASMFQIAASAGPLLTEYLTGTAFAGDASLTVRPARADFGRVTVGRPATRVIQLSDPGQQPMIITGTTALAPPFRLIAPVATGQPIGPQGGVGIPIEFSPRQPGPFTATYRIRCAPLGGGPSREVEITVTGTAVTAGG